MSAREGRQRGRDWELWERRLGSVGDVISYEQRTGARNSMGTPFVLSTKAAIYNGAQRCCVRGDRPPVEDIGNSILDDGEKRTHSVTVVHRLPPSGPML